MSSLERCRNGCDEPLKEEKMELDQHTQLAGKRSWLVTLLVQIGCFLWLVPIVALLTLNSIKYVIGASAWCPKKNCYVGWFNVDFSVPLKNLESFDRHDHDLLGVIQLIAKALEVWFVVVSLCLVYLLTFMIAGREDGLPIGYLMRPNEFAELYGLFDPLLWKSLPHVHRSKKTSRSRFYRFRIYLFIGFTVCLCILCNLMGPAAAVLALPSLQWIDTQPVGDQIFGTLSSKNAPSAAGIGPFRKNSLECIGTDFQNLNFSCAAEPFASQLDSWIDSCIAAGSWAKVESQQEAVQFSINETYRVSNSNIATQELLDVTWWVPNRQVLSGLTRDYQMMAAVSVGLDAETTQNYTGPYPSDTLETYGEYNRSLQMRIQRNGPIIGTLVQFHSSYDGNTTWTSILDDTRQINCYSGYTVPSIDSVNYTKCVRVGNGWSSDNKLVAFSMRDFPENSTDQSAANIDLKIFTSDKAQFFANGKLPPWLSPDCLSAGKVSSSIACDWERLFHVPADNDLFNRTRNITTIEMTSKHKVSGTAFTLKLSVDFVAFLNFTNYQLDPSPLTNPATLVQTQDLPKTGDSILVDPSWVLAAWTVDNRGVLNPDRTAVIKTLQIMDIIAQGQLVTSDVGLEVTFVLGLPILQALSLIDFKVQNSVALGQSPRSDDARHPLLTRNARLYVWAYGFGSRTSKLGLVVVSFGIAVVVAQLVLGFIDRRKYSSPTQLLVAALEHAPSGEFKDVQHDEAKVASLRFHVQGMMTTAGKYSFTKTMGHEAE